MTSELDREEIVEKLKEKGHTGDEAERMVGTGTFHKVDESRKTVTGKCSHHFEVDEPGDVIRHIVCGRCGFGKYTNNQVVDGQIVLQSQ